MHDLPPPSLDYARSPLQELRPASKSSALSLTVFIGIIFLIEFALIAVGNDRTPGSWNDLLVLLANPFINIGLAATLGSCSVAFIRRGPLQFVMHFLIAILGPLIGGFCIYNTVHH